ncbi:transglycosylase SLT domain-containing protein [Streptomyces nanshensis]|nr:transglycosylase SLT domain-containing protein [Streptomyces nanshensis]
MNRPASLPRTRAASGALLTVVAALGASDSPAQEPAAPSTPNSAHADRASAVDRHRPDHQVSRAGSRAGARTAPGEVPKRSAAQAKPYYPDTLDGWIKQARDIMAVKHIPGSHAGIKRNILRESGGDPNAMNDWDINAQKGTPSKGLLQTIQPTFDAYHVDGTSKDITDPVANIVAACNYAADKYGSIDNVNGPY